MDYEDTDTLPFTEIEYKPVEIPSDTYEGMATTFANKEDVVRYKAAKKAGLSDQEAFKVGDNGIGAWGDDTTSEDVPMVALPPDTPGFARDRKVVVYGPGGSVQAQVKDKMPRYENLKGDGNIDLNPAATKLVGGTGLTPVKWKWADEGAVVNTTLPTRKAPEGVLRNARTIDDGEELSGGIVDESLADQEIDASAYSAPAETAAGPAPMPKLGGGQVDKIEGSKIYYNDGRVADRATQTITYKVGDMTFMMGRDRKPKNITPKAPPKSPENLAEDAAARKGILRGDFSADPVGEEAYKKARKDSLTDKRDAGTLTTSEKLQVLRTERQAYNDNPATIAMYGKGQMPGLHQIKTKLDAMYNASGGDYSKMNPQELASYVFAFGKLNDPNSAVLLGEYQAAASRLGIGDRATLALNKLQKGDPITPTQAADINQTVNTVYDAFKGQHFRDLEQREEDLKENNVPVRKLAIPPNVLSEFEQWKQVKKDDPQADTASTAAPTTMVKVRAPDGKTGSIPKANAEKAKAKGYVILG